MSSPLPMEYSTLSMLRSLLRPGLVTDYDHWALQFGWVAPLAGVWRGQVRVVGLS